MSKNSERNEIVDYMKAIGIISVVVNHCGGFWIGNAISLYMLPIFFFCSGVLFSLKKDKRLPFGKFLHRKFKSLIIPYYGLCIINAIFYMFSLPLWGWYDSVWSYVMYFLPSLFGINTIDKYYYISTLWFIPALFANTVLFKAIINMLSDKKRVRYCVWGGMVLSQVFFCRYQYAAIYRIDTIPFFLPFMALGFEITESGAWEKHCREKVNVTFILIGAGVIYFCGNRLGFLLDAYSGLFPRCCGTFVGGCAGILMVFEMSKIIKRAPHFIREFFSFWGINSMWLMVIHQHYIIYLLNKCGVLINYNVHEQLARVIICIVITFLVIQIWKLTSIKVFSKNEKFH